MKENGKGGYRPVYLQPEYERAVQPFMEKRKKGAKIWQIKPGPWLKGKEERDAASAARIELESQGKNAFYLHCIDLMDQELARRRSQGIPVGTLYGEE